MPMLMVVARLMDMLGVVNMVLVSGDVLPSPVRLVAGSRHRSNRRRRFQFRDRGSNCRGGCSDRRWRLFGGFRRLASRSGQYNASGDSRLNELEHGSLPS